MTPDQDRYARAMTVASPRGMAYIEERDAERAWGLYHAACVAVFGVLWAVADRERAGETARAGTALLDRETALREFLTAAGCE